MKTCHDDEVSQLHHEVQNLKEEVKMKVEENSKLVETLKHLRDTCFEIVTRCSTRLREIFHSVVAASEVAMLCS
jgi:regulator of replication initiation timing